MVFAALNAAGASLNIAYRLHVVSLRVGFCFIFFWRKIITCIGDAVNKQIKIKLGNCCTSVLFISLL